jgi:shikimate 5-dehydrogenase
MLFVGVTTGQSVIPRLFPLWAAALDLDARLDLRDLPLASPRSAYRALVDEVARSPDVRGALITSHKVGFHEHARDRIDELGTWARRCREVSCLRAVGGGGEPRRVLGDALDPVAAAATLAAMIGDDHWRDHPDAEVLILGAGGSGTAISSLLALAEAPPRRVVVTARSDASLRRLGEIHRALGTSANLSYARTDEPAAADELIASLPAHSLVVNATGMGKDRPGSPIRDARFPDRGVAWELNYRGDLPFLAEALRQRSGSHLIVEDGWRFFLQEWIAHISMVFGRPVTPPETTSLIDLAEPFRPVHAEVGVGR